MDIVIRPLAVAELPQLIELQRQTLLCSIKSHYTDRQVQAIINSQAQFWNVTMERIFVAEQQGELVGFAAVMVTSAQIAGVYVHPAKMRQGIGSKLVQHLEQLMLDDQVQQLTVMSALNAIPFYQALGYQILGKTYFWALISIAGWLPWPIKIPCVALRKCFGPHASDHIKKTRLKVGQYFYLLVLFVIAFLLVIL